MYVDFSVEFHWKFCARRMATHLLLLQRTKNPMLLDYRLALDHENEWISDISSGGPLVIIHTTIDCSHVSEHNHITTKYKYTTRGKWHTVKYDFFALKLSTTTERGRCPIHKVALSFTFISSNGTTIYYPLLLIFNSSTLSVHKRYIIS